MKISQLETEYIVTAVDNHEDLKTKLLNFFDSDRNFKSYNSVSRTDWHLPAGYQRNYIQCVSVLDSIIVKSLKNLGYNTVTLINYWFQQYENNSEHNWHTHPGINFTNVYYVELPEQSLTTQVKNLLGNVITPTVSEGEILSLPGHTIHRSPVNNSGKRKTVVVMNYNVET